MSGADGTRAERTTLRELAALFLRLGTTAFGGPAAHIAMMEDEVVRRRRWLTEDRFLDLLGATNLIPGPNSTEMAIHIGYERRRWAGLVVAGVSFIVPAMLITGAVAWAYVSFGELPQAGWLLYGVKPVILAVVVQALWNLAPRAARTWPLRLLGVEAAVAVALGVNEIAVLFGAGALVALARAMTPRPAKRGEREKQGRSNGLFSAVAATASGASALAGAGAAAGAGAGAAAAGASVGLGSLFWVFLKIGSVLFGSGYVLLAFLRAEIVLRRTWLTEAQLIDAIAAGQITPGPVFTTATFVGYVLSGPTGALVATAGIFLPAFVFVALSGPLVPRLRSSRLAGAFLDGVNVASLALMAVVTAQLGRAAIRDIPTALLGVMSAALLLRYKLSSTWLILAGAAGGLGAHALGLAR